MTNRLLIFIAALSCAGFSVASGEQYWIAYEGNDFPENEGWGRRWGNWDGPYEGDGAIRTLEGGVLTLDSMYDEGVYDYAYVERPGATDPAPGELFVVEWRGFVEEASTDQSYDAAVAIASDDAWLLGFGLYRDRVRSTFEGVNIPVAPGVFHGYRVESPDMRTYDLYVDGALAHSGSFWYGLTPSFVRWGNGAQGVSSESQWDYVRCGVIPEPAMWLSVCILVIPGSRMRRERAARQ